MMYHIFKIKFNISFLFNPYLYLETNPRKEEKDLQHLFRVTILYLSTDQPVEAYMVSTCTCQISKKCQGLSMKYNH